MPLEESKSLEYIRVGDGRISLCEKPLSDGSLAYDVICYDSDGKEVFAFYPANLDEAVLLMDSIKKYGAN